MSATVSKIPLLKDLLKKTVQRIEEIKTNAETVIYGMTASTSALSQSATYSREDAAIILDACNEALEILEAQASGNSGTGSAPAPSFGHGTRFQPVQNPPGCTWGC